jgi:TRAP-type mannitol/chloroaromatic compound transport system permease small subunit
VSGDRKGFSGFLDAISIKVGHATSWLTLLMVFVTFVIVVMRYVFGAGLIWLQESVTWMHAVVFMLGAAYTLQQEQHVRVDIFYRKMSFRCAAFSFMHRLITWPVPGHSGKYRVIPAVSRIHLYRCSSLRC